MSEAADATALRAAFDASFAAPPRVLGATVEVLLLRVQERSYGVPLDQVQGVERLGEIVPLPGRLPELVGLTVVRGGALVPVYDLAALLGLGPASSGWLLLAGSPTLALAVAAIEPQVTVPETALTTSHGPVTSLTPGTVGLGPRTLPLLDLVRLHLDVARRAAPLPRKDT